MDILKKKSFKIELFKGCLLYGILKFDKENKSYLKYYDEKGEITVDLENYNSLIINSIIKQAEIICQMKYVVLWSY